ncbi:MAG TPA: translation initiation factor IF-2 N-terminal domain-containing protein [Planctomicrobium sp.]|nr:translation initiation factor IF-2 N-terminal domain-containing protein [Planctomicrobium sp.]
MRVHELAKELNIPSKEVLSVAESAGIKVTSASSKLTDPELIILRKVISKTAELQADVPKPRLVIVDDPTAPTTAEQSAQRQEIIGSTVITPGDLAQTILQTEPDFKPDGPFTGKMVMPPRLYKYARSRQLTLQAAIEACDELGIPNPRDFMELDQERILKLDAHFISKIPF